VYLVFIRDDKESFINSPYKKQKIPYEIKQDPYMNFLGDLNDSYRKHLEDVNKDSNSPIRQKALCDDRIRKDVQSKALIEAFEKVKEKDIKDSNLFDTNIPSDSRITYSTNNYRSCGNKASQLCDLTDPMLYMSQNTRFPPRWIFKPYRDVSLPKHTDLKCWSNMVNCCKKNF
jgi:hypothetical protein